MSASDTQVGGDHYKSLAIQPAEFCQRNRLGYLEGLAIKYLCRHGRKNGREDLEKAIHCIQMLIEMEYPSSKADAVALDILR
jgi:hypothetical protein